MELPIKIEVDGNIINDRKKYGQLKAFEVIKESSQVGATQISFLLGAEKLIDNYKKFGFSKPVNINFPSTSFGSINSRDEISDIEIATLGYGYGLTATPFQISQAYAIFANKGAYYDFKIIKDNEFQIFSEQIISEKTANDVLFSMREVIEDGTGILARLENFDVSGKTGTTEKLRDGNYKSSSYTASFIGIGPNPPNELTIFVNIDGLGSQKYSGGSVAAPLFKKISNDVFSYMGYFNK
jgi:cell division protein FtsI (penicillin-binding protein 3)